MESNNIKGLIEFLSDIEDGLETSVAVNKAYHFRMMLIKRFGRAINVCKITVDGNNPLILPINGTATIKEEVLMHLDNSSNFEVVFDTMPLYMFEALPEHNGW